MKLSVSEITIYPVKSCAGIALKQANVGVTGFEHDREWMVVDPNGNFITQRQNPKMALIIPEITDNGLLLHIKDNDSLKITNKISGRIIPVIIWNDRCDAIDQGDKAAGWLSDFLERECRLVRMAPSFKRKVKAKYAQSESDAVGFADGYPFLVISQASLDDLNSRLKQTLPSNRFRPNIVINGGTAFQEDQWKQIQLGAVTFAIVKPCIRCEITTVDQETGIKGIEPLQELGKFRSSPKGVKFGQNAIHLNRGNITVGDTVTIIK